MDLRTNQNPHHDNLSLNQTRSISSDPSKQSEAQKNSYIHQFPSYVKMSFLKCISHLPSQRFILP